MNLDLEEEWEGEVQFGFQKRVKHERAGSWRTDRQPKIQQESLVTTLPQPPTVRIVYAARNINGRRPKEYGVYEFQYHPKLRGDMALVSRSSLPSIQEVHIGHRFAYITVFVCFTVECRSRARDLTHL